jgi:hypothetical protein
VYLRLVNVRKVDWQGRAHFYAICARMMRRVLTDFARSRCYLKRGGDAVHLMTGTSRKRLRSALPGVDLFTSR